MDSKVGCSTAALPLGQGHAVLDRVLTLLTANFDTSHFVLMKALLYGNNLFISLEGNRGSELRNDLLTSSSISKW